MDRRIQILVCMVFIVYVENASSSCFSSNMQSALNSAHTYAQRLNSYLDKCDRDNDLKKLMKLLGRHTEQVMKDINMINVIYHKRKWTRFNSHCYYFSPSAYSWQSAKAHCERYQSSLVKIDDREEEKWLQRSIENQRQVHRSVVNSYWIDLRAKIGKFTWTQDNTEPKFMRFETGYPKSPDTDSYCVFLSPHKKWHNGVCNTSRQFVCESDLCY